LRKKYRIIFLVPAILTFIGGVISLFLPYLVKLNIHSGDLTLPEMYEGYHYRLTMLILFILLTTIFSIALSNRQIFNVILSAIILILTYLVRLSIHFQGMIDHDYDSKTGLGFKLLFSVVVFHFVICIGAFVVERKELKTNAMNSH